MSFSLRRSTSATSPSRRCKVVVVKTDGGYQPDASRAGTGEVAATICG